MPAGEAAVARPWLAAASGLGTRAAGEAPAAALERRALAAEQRAKTLSAQLDQQQLLLETATVRASEADGQLADAQERLRQLQRDAQQSREGREDRRRVAKRAAGQVAAEAMRWLATQQVAAAAAAEHVAGVDAALAQVSGPGTAELPLAAAAAVARAAQQAQAAAADLARLLQQQAELEARLQRQDGLERLGNQPDLGPPAAAVPGCRRLWIGGVVLKPSEKEVLRAVEKYGAVESVRILASRRCLFVDYEEPAAAARALRALHGRAVPQLSGGRALTVQYQKEAAGSASSSSSASTAAAAAAAAAAAGLGHPGPPARTSSTLSAAAPEWQPSVSGSKSSANGGGHSDDWETAAEAAWAAAGWTGGWREVGEDEDSGWDRQQHDGGGGGGYLGSSGRTGGGGGASYEDSQEDDLGLDLPDVLLPSELLDDSWSVGSAPSATTPASVPGPARALPLPLPLALHPPGPRVSAAGSASSGGSSRSSDGSLSASGEFPSQLFGGHSAHSRGSPWDRAGADQDGAQQAQQGPERDASPQQAQQAASCSLVVRNILPQQRWKPHEFTRKIEAAFRGYGPVVAVDVPKLRSCAFVHYSDAGSAGKALAALHGAILPEVTGGKPLDIQFSHRERPRTAFA